MKKILLLFAPFFLLCAATLHAQVLINEVCPANADINYDPNHFNYSPWVELYNPTASAVDIGGYFLSDDQSNKTKWQFPGGTTVPANGYLLVWCDEMWNGLHTGFSLDSDGEDVVLSSPSLLLVDKVTFPKQYTNISYGRIPNGGTTWGYMVTPSPKTANLEGTGTVQLENPVFSLKSGRYSSVQSLSITHGQGGTIRYTTDGSEPNGASTAYTAPIPVNTTKTIKAKAFLDNFLPSKTEVRTYFINEHVFTLPVVSLTMKPDYLWNNTIGIYTDGTNGIDGNCQNNPMNWNQDWDRHAVFEYFEPNGNKLFDQPIDIRIGGACSRSQPQKSLVFKARDKYGKKTIDEKLFPNKLSSSYGGFVLRNSGNDFNVTMFRDALMQAIPVGQMDIDYMDYQPTIFYLNNQYWGIQNMREKIDADYFEANYGVKKNDLDLMETYGNALEGTPDAYSNYLNTLAGLAPNDPATFDFIDAHVDVQELINYLVLEIYYCNTDWPGNNMKFWRQRSTNGKFRWILWDTDFGFALYDGASYATHPTLHFATDPNSGVDWPNPPWATAHIRLLMANPEFRSRFIQTMATAMSTTLKPDRVISYIDEFQNRIKTEMVHHKQRWWGTMDDFNYEVQRLRDFAVARNTFMKSYTASFFGLGENVNVSISASPVGTGNFKWNGVTSDQPLVNGSYYKGLPYAIEPAPMPGFAFKEWHITKRETTAVPMINTSSTWKYFDQGSLPASNWMASEFNDAPWVQGAAQLGYGEGDEQTIVGYGGDSQNKFITTYFRKKFNLASVADLTGASVSMLVDDGAVVYLNGAEVYRFNMPDGTIGNSTLAPDAAAENVYITFTIPADKFVAGDNILAVEVHQNGPTSTDVSFEFSMSGTKAGDETHLTSTDPVLSDVANTDLVVEAVYEPTSSIGGIVINEICAANTEHEDNFGEKDDFIELHNTSSVTVDLAGLFITDDLANKTKYQLPAGTGNQMKLGAGQYKVLWADDSPAQGPEHLPFKLSADGESVGLYQAVGLDMTTLDVYTFAEQPDKTSYSRLPDATGPFRLTLKTTPGAVNELEIFTGVGETNDKAIVIYPNPTAGDIHIRAERPLDAVFVYDHQGRMIRQWSNLEPESVMVVTGITSGLYLVQARMGTSQYTWRVIHK